MTEFIPIDSSDPRCGNCDDFGGVCGATNVDQYACVVMFTVSSLPVPANPWLTMMSYLLIIAPHLLYPLLLVPTVRSVIFNWISTTTTQICVYFYAILLFVVEGIERFWPFGKGDKDTTAATTGSSTPTAPSPDPVKIQMPSSNNEVNLDSQCEAEEPMSA